MRLFSIHLRPSEPYPNPVSVGDKLRFGATMKQQLRPILKKRYMVARLKKRKFEPLLIVVYVERTQTNFSVVTKAFNF